MANEKLENLVNNLQVLGVLKTPKIIEAFLKIDRRDFIPEEIKNLAYLDEALAIGRGQTISQPYTVAFMLELLEPKAGEKIMDIGTGSGWQTALLAYLASKPAPGETLGKVFAIERIPELCQFGKANVSKYNFIEKEIVEWFCQDASSGLPQFAPFDKIIVAAEVDKIPEPWKKQLKIGGKMVIPIKNSIWLFIKKSEKNSAVPPKARRASSSEAGWETKEYPGFVFVPFIQE